VGLKRAAHNGLILKVEAARQRSGWNHFQKVRRLFNLIVSRTPVYTGTLRYNWVATYDRVRYSYTEGHDPNAPLPPAMFNLEYDPKDPFRKISISNYTPYVQRIEFGSWSQAAPYGMVRISMKEVFSV